MKQKLYQILGIVVLGIVLSSGLLLAGSNKVHMYGPDMSVDDMRGDMVATKDTIINKLIAQGDYACCLDVPCTYCIEKTPKHGEGATCNCLADIMTGVHPCGECIGEILEGHGNPYLAKYFAKALAEEVGQKYYQTLKSIIQDKYGLVVAGQI
ncbi:hypothetical protein KKE14_00080 [Patescibacteria group bacterium]|nr:hypothetical protein [Patescibacteria group bacterium]